MLSDNKLTITLKDFVDWTIYSKEYTKEHIGGEIHQKMDLFDVYTAFSQTKSNHAQENVNSHFVRATKFKHYEFGSVVYD